MVLEKARGEAGKMNEDGGWRAVVPVLQDSWRRPMGGDGASPLGFEF